MNRTERIPNSKKNFVGMIYHEVPVDKIVHDPI